MRKLIIILLLLSGVALLFFYMSIWPKNRAIESAGEVHQGDTSKSTSVNENDQSPPSDQGASTSQSNNEALVPTPEKTAVTPDNNDLNFNQPDLSQGSPRPTEKMATGNRQGVEQDKNAANVEAGATETGQSKATDPSATTRSLSQGTPATIPVEQAAYYFVPKEQRAPGNLGGPPPLPTASSVPSTPAVTPLPQGGIQPPAAPGSAEPASNPLAPPPAFQ